jgi:hypothetical protein
MSKRRADGGSRRADGGEGASRIDGSGHEQREEIGSVENKTKRKHDKMRRASSKLFQEQQRRCGLLDGRPNPESYALDTARRQRDYQEDCTKQQRKISGKGKGTSLLIGVCAASTARLACCRGESAHSREQRARRTSGEIR